MQISWFGYGSFRLQNDGTSLITDPVETAFSFSINRQGADIVVASNPDSDPASAISGSPFVIKGPGEYEVKSIFVHGIPAGGRVVYAITIDDIAIAFLGGARLKDIGAAQLEVLEGSDILIVPVGGGSVASAKDAVELINQIEPRIVIPSYYKISGSKGLDSVDVFLKEYSAPREDVEKLKLHRRDLPQEDTRVVLLKP